MTAKRDLSLINKEMRNFVAANFLTGMLICLTETVNGIIVGNFISPDALSAIALFVPFTFILYAFESMVAVGAYPLLGQYIGGREYEKSERTISAMVAAVLVLSLLLITIAFFFAPLISRALCENEVIGGFFTKYLRISLAFGGVKLFFLLFKNFAIIDGNPQTVTKIVLSGSILQLVLSYFLIAFAGWDITGAAYAEGTATLFEVILLYLNTNQRFRKTILQPFKTFSWGYLKQNMAKGTPFVASKVLSAIMYMVMDIVILKHEGPNGMFALAIILQLLSITYRIDVAFGSTVSSLGAILIGQNDNQAFANIGRKCLLASSIIVTLLVFVTALFPDVVSVCFGASSPELIKYCSDSVRISLFILLAYSLSVYLMFHYPTEGFVTLSTVVSVAFPLTITVLLFTWHADSTTVIWYAFPQTGVIFLVLLFISSGIQRRKKGNLTLLTLFPKDYSQQHIFDCSVTNGDRESLNRSLISLNNWLNELAIGSQTMNKVNLCLEELMLNEMEFSQNKGHYDIHVSCKDNRLLAFIKDAGVPFDPTTCPEHNLGPGLKIVKGLCPNFEYKYMCGLNITSLKWEL